MGARIGTHRIEDISKSYVSTIINESGTALYREITGRDYGIDAIVEIFENEMPTGKIAFLQIKATDKLIIPLKKRPNFVSCPRVSRSNLSYALQHNIPVILMYVHLKREKGFYYTILNDYNEDEIREKIEEQKTTTIHIPARCHIERDSTEFIESINNFYK